MKYIETVKFPTHTLDKYDVGCKFPFMILKKEGNAKVLVYDPRNMQGR